MQDWDSTGVWSDDGQSALGVYRFYEGRDTGTHVRIRNIETEVYFFPSVSSSERRLIAPRAPGWARPLYLVNELGYAIIHRQEDLPELDDGMNKTARYTAFKVDLDGGTRSLGERQYLSMISCDPAGQSAVSTGDVLTVIPSPDGRMLARLEMSSTCQGRTGQLTFLDADTLSVLDGPIELPRVADVNMIINRAWSRNGRFMISETGFLGPRGQSYAPNTDAADTGSIDYSCYFPETLSGTVNAQGQTLDNVDGVFRVREGSSDTAVFGCR